jgi:hypothetical protein
VSGCESITKLEYSQCGQYYVIHRTDKLPPSQSGHSTDDGSLQTSLEIHPLPWSPRSVAEPEEPPSQEVIAGKKRKLNHHGQSVLRGTSSSSINLPSNSDSSLSIVDSQSRTVIGISPSYHNGSRQIEITSQTIGQGEVTSCSLVKLPDKTCVQNINTCLQTIDDEGCHRVRVVLTPESRATYESDIPTVSKILPAVIHRDVSLLNSNAVKRKVAVALIQDDGTGGVANG